MVDPAVRAYAGAKMAKLVAEAKKRGFLAQVRHETIAGKEAIVLTAWLTLEA